MILIPDSALGTMGWQDVSSVARFSQGATALIGFAQQNAKGKTIMKTIKRTSILRPCNFDWPPELKPDYAINPYIGCAHNCSYCWARDMTYRFRKQWKIPDDFEWDKPLVVENALELLKEEIWRKRPGRVLLSSMTDPYQAPMAERMLPILKTLLWNDLGWQVIILTKATEIPVYDWGWLGTDHYNWLGVTIDQGQLSEANIKRMNLVALAHMWGMQTFISLEPWRPSDTGLQKVIAYIGEVVGLWILGSLNKNGRAVNPEFYKRELPPLIEWMDKEGIRYYIKKELRRCVNGGMIN